jgi:hypothetical protein
VKPGSGMKAVTDMAGKEITALTKKDMVVVWGGANDIAKNEANNGLTHISNFVKLRKQMNVLIVDAPTRFDLPTTSCVNKEVVVYNRKLYKRMKQFEHVNIINSELHRKYFTKHGMHMKTAGKEQMTQRLAERIWETFSKKETSPITLQWKQDVAKRIVSPRKYDTETNMGEAIDNPQENQSLQSGIDNENANKNSENTKETVFLSFVTEYSKNSLKDVDTSFSVSNLKSSRRKKPSARSDDFLWT